MIAKTNAELSINSEFFKLHYFNPGAYDYGGPAFKITSKLINSSNCVQYALPTAEIESQRLDISAYSKHQYIPANITLHVTPEEFVDNTTKVPINNDHDTILKVDESGIHLETPGGCSTATEPVIELTTRKPDGIVDINSGNITMTAGYSQNDSNVIVGGEFEVSSYTSDIKSMSYINMTARTSSSELEGTGASIRISSPLDDLNTTGASKVEISTSEFLVGSSGLKFINMSTLTQHTIETDDTTLRFIAPDSRFDDTNSVVIAFKDGGCMSFTRNGISVNTTPEGATSAISGNALLSQSLRSIERMTQSEYDAIETKDENTLYIIAG